MTQTRDLFAEKLQPANQSIGWPEARPGNRLAIGGEQEVTLARGGGPRSQFREYQRYLAADADDTLFDECP
jgi:hypothetical protein